VGTPSVPTHKRNVNNHKESSTMKKITLVAWRILILGCFGLISPAFAGPDAPYQAITDKFFENLSKDRYEEAFDQIFAHNRWIQKDNPQKFTQSRSQFSTFKGTLGSYRGSVKLAERETAGMFAHQLYLVMFDKGPIGIRFQYYKPEGTWEFFGFWSVQDINVLLGQRAEQEVLLPLPLLPPPAKPSAVDLRLERERTPPIPLARNDGE
jgi:hypothetical protein